MSKVLFLDIDGVLLPGRAYKLPNQTFPIVKVFDPCAVAMLNDACRKQRRKIVIHSSWIRPHNWQIGLDGHGDVHDHLVSQGVDPDLFHEDLYCNRDIHWRYDRISEWLGRHPEVTDFFILDDEPENPREGPEKFKDHLVLTNFEEGITMKVYHRILDGVAPRKKG